MYSSDIYQAGVTPGIKIFRRGQGVPDWPNSLLLYKDKESAKSSRFSPHQLALAACKQEYDVGWLLGRGGAAPLQGLSCAFRQHIRIKKSDLVHVDIHIVSPTCF